MRTILSVALLGTALGVSAYILSERSHNHPVNAQAVAAATPKTAERGAEEFEMSGKKKRCFDASREAILKELKAPQTARFAEVMSDVKFQQGEADAYQLSSYVDAQNALGALIRMKWETLFDKNEKLVWMKIDEDELEPLEDVVRRLKGLPSREDERRFAAEKAERVRGAMEERAREQREQLKNPKYREALHAYAQKYLTSKLELQSHHDIKHSKLPKKDDKYTACYWLGNDVWEATGLVHSIRPPGKRRVRQPWKVSMGVSKNNQPEVLAYTLGNDEIGKPEVARTRAGVKPPEVPVAVAELPRSPLPAPRPLLPPAGDLGLNTTHPSLPSATPVAVPSGIIPRQFVTARPIPRVAQAPATALATPNPSLPTTPVPSLPNLTASPTAPSGTMTPAVPLKPLERSSPGVAPRPKSSENWRVYSPGTQPLGRTIAPVEAATLAGSVVAGERLYLSGNFFVSAKGEDKAVLRPRGADSGPVPVRVIAEFPRGSVVPPENSMVARDSSRAFEILDITRTEDGTVNVRVRDITLGQ